MLSTNSVVWQCLHVIAFSQSSLRFSSFGMKTAKCTETMDASGCLGKVNRPTIFFYLAVAVVVAKISFVKNLSIFKKRETLQIRHKQSNKHVFRVCMHSYMYITKVN